MVKRHLDVVCGIVVNRANQVLIALRNLDKDQGGVWEFPGGKLERGETLQDALCRELSEEIDIDVLEADPWMQVHYEYDDYHVTLHVWNVIDYEGKPTGNEGQPICWVDYHELSQFEFPFANKSIVEALIADRCKTTLFS